MRRRSPVTTFILYIGVLVVCAYGLFPFVWMILSSFKLRGDLYTVPPNLIPHRFTLVNYANVFLESNIPRYFLNSTVVATGSTLLGLAVAILGAYGFARYQFRGKGALKVAVLSSQMIPTAAIIVPLFITLRVLRLINTYWGLILCYLILTLPLSVWMLNGYLLTVPREIEESASIDGAGKLRTLLQIVVPVAVPGIVATAIYCFVVTWNEFIFALSFATDQRVMTLPIGLAEFTQEFTTDWGALMAASVIMTLPIVVLFFFLQRQFVSGLTAGSSK